MKRIYNQPTVTTINLMGGSVMQAASPAAGISGGGSTGSIGGGATPIPGE